MATAIIQMWNNDMMVVRPGGRGGNGDAEKWMGMHNIHIQILF